MIWMSQQVKSYVRETLKISHNNIILVSGGAAWADHIAVQLYLTGEFAGLELFFTIKIRSQTKEIR